MGERHTGRKRGTRGERGKERETDGETLRWAETECSCTCVVTCRVCVRWLPKKSGTTDITPSAERRGQRGEEEVEEKPV